MVSSSSASKPRPASPHRRRRRGPLAAILATLLILGLFAGGGYYAWHSLFPGTAASDSCQVVGQSTGNVYAIDPEQLLNASIIADVAMRRGLPERAVVVALATARQESKLRNLDYGDADSVGLFQQRTSQGWGSTSELMTPTTSAGKFYDALLKVKGWESMSVSQAAQAVQRSAFPDAYAQWEPMATAFGAALTGETSGLLSCRLVHPGVTAAAKRTIEPAGTPGFTGPATVEAAGAATATALAADLGVTAAPSGSVANKATLAVTGLGADNPRRRTATVAAWSIAHAAYFGITEVVAGDQLWRAGRTGWQHTSAAAAPDTVRLTVAR